MFELLWFLAGMIVGGTLGIVFMAMLAVAAQADRDAQCAFECEECCTK